MQLFYLVCPDVHLAIVLIWIQPWEKEEMKFNPLLLHNEILSKVSIANVFKTKLIDIISKSGYLFAHG